MASNFKVIIVGLGIAGAVTAILLERAGIDYIVLERAPTIPRSGTATALNAQTLRLFDQLGLLERLTTVGMPVRRIAFFRQNLQPLTSISLEKLEQRHGYTSLLVMRAELMEILLEAIPSERIHWNKRVLDVTEYRTSVTVKTQDGMDYDGHIVIGADGAYSAVRQHLFRNLKKRGQPVPESDLENFRFDMIATTGTAKNLDRWMYRALRESSVDMMAIVSDDGPHTAWLLPLKGERIGWLFGSKRKDPKKNQNDHTFRLSEWALRADESVYDQGATQAIHDAVCLVNLLHEMPKENSRDILHIFSTYYDQRYSVVQSSIQSSNMLAGLATKTGKVANVTRRIATKLIPQAVIARSLDKMMVHRPIASFLPPPPARGKVPPRPQNTWRIYQNHHHPPPSTSSSFRVNAPSYAHSGTSYSMSSLSLKPTVTTSTSSSSQGRSASQHDLREFADEDEDEICKDFHRMQEDAKPCAPAPTI
ncbi:hypothetical protein BGZ73_001797 [Actinomortierella ambigua]|nr:hypothetical protein BGZ73_001797 [Actinomortierella ambigua]